MREKQIADFNRALGPLQHEVMVGICYLIAGRGSIKSLDGIRIGLDPQTTIQSDGGVIRLENAGISILNPAGKNYIADRLERTLKQRRSRERAARFLNDVLNRALEATGSTANDLVGLNLVLGRPGMRETVITAHRGPVFPRGAKLRVEPVAYAGKRTPVTKYTQPDLPSRSLPSTPSTTATTQGLPKAGLLEWEVLPSGWWDIRWFDGRSEGETRRPSKDALERIRFINSFDPARWYLGKSLGTRYYYVALFAGVAVAESPVWGNALYYCATRADEWRVVFRKTKREALRAGARRIIHRTHWKARVERLIRASAARLQTTSVEEAT